MAEKPEKFEAVDGDGKIFDEAMSRWDEVIDREKDQRRRSAIDRIFVAEEGGHWADELSNGGSTVATNDANETIDDDERPRFEFNMLAAEISRVVGEQRKINVGPKISPEGAGDKGTADTITGIIRNIEKVSKARSAYNNAFEEIAQGGYGGFQITTSFMSDDVFDQEIKVEAILDATTSLFYGPSKRYDKSDAPWCFLAFMKDKGVFKATYPDAEPVDFDDSNTIQTIDNEDWFTDESVRLAVYWRKVSIKKTIVQLSNGDTEDLADIEKVLDELANPTDGSEPITVVNQRETQTFKLERYLMNGNEILESTLDYKGKFFPYIPVFGDRSFINSREIVHGKVRFSKDASRGYNFFMSSEIERFALSASPFYWVTPEQVGNHTEDYEDMNTSRKAARFYDTVKDLEGNVVSAAPPVKDQGPVMQPGVQQFAATLKMDVFATMGSSGQASTDGTAMDRRSGEAIQASGALIDAGWFSYIDNWFQSIEQGYRVIADLLPHIMDTAQQVKIIKPDGETEMTFINKVVRDEDTGKEVVVNDLSLGRYAVDISTGAAFATQRKEASDRLIAFTENDPEMRALANDLIVKNMDGPEMEELAKRLFEGKVRRGEIIPTPEQAQEMGLERDQLVIQNARPQIEQEVMQGMQGQLLQAQITASNAVAAEAQAKASTAQVDSQSKAQLNQQRGEADIIKAQAQLLKEQNAQVKNEADVRNTDADTNKINVDANNAYLDGLVIKAQSLGIPLTILDHDNRVGQEDLVELSQMVIDPQLNSNQQAAGQQIANLEALINGRQGLRAV